MFGTTDYHQISETLALHGYVVDENQLDRLDELFTPDAVYDMRSTGMGIFEGVATIRAAAAGLAASGHAPRAHLVTNILITETAEPTESVSASARVRSRGLMIMHDGSLEVVDHDDVLRLHEGRWRISRRVINPLRPHVHAIQAG